MSCTSRPRPRFPNSIQDPSGYWSTNVDGSRSLLEAMRATGVGRIVFSSTAAVYAHGLDRPIRETDPIVPATPYGTSKLAVEHLLQGYADAYGFGATALRYFNACGADPDGAHGEAHRSETHVIPLLIQAALGQRRSFKVYGDRWPTPDGTCIRDFVSVAGPRRGAPARAAPMLELGQDGALQPRLRRRHQRAGASRRRRAPRGRARPALDRGAPRRATRRSWSPTSPRPGSGLGWTPRHSGIEDILATAFRWHSQGGLMLYEQTGHEHPRQVA